MLAEMNHEIMKEFAVVTASDKQVRDFLNSLQLYHSTNSFGLINLVKNDAALDK